MANVNGRRSGGSVDLASPGAIGGTTPAAITGTTITATAAFVGPVGTVASASFQITGEAGNGIYRPAANQLGFTHSGSSYLVSGVGFVRLRDTSTLGWSSGAPTSAADTILLRDAAGTVAQRNGTSAQASSLYDTFTSATDYHRLSMRTARASVAAASGLTVTATNLIPDGAILLGLTTKVTTGLGFSLGLTGYRVGDGTDNDRWGDVVGTAAGTSSDNTSWTATTVQAFTSAQSVVLSSVGGNFDGTGVIYVSAQYLIGECD